jgi:predicted nucleic acid-binding protein
METVTTKILDNTFISACVTDINSKDLVAVCDLRYSLVAPLSVYKESLNYSDREIMKKCYEKIVVIDMTNSEIYNELLQYLTNRFPNLHEGELSAFLVALLEYELKGKRYFYITDDLSMRKSIQKIRHDELFIQKLKSNFSNFNFSGTIGLINRLVKGNLIDVYDLNKIIDDLENGSFYLDPSLIEYLRNE